MHHYDIAVIGGGIGGSVAARFAAQQGFKTLLIEKGKTPRNKPCSGIQFAYFEKLIGAEIPPDKLCQNELYKVEIVAPSGRIVQGRMKMLNFWRSTFDDWLNQVAAQHGAEFRDNTRLLDFEQRQDGVELHIETGRQPSWPVRARYVIAADGLYSQMRKKLRPGDFKGKASSGTMNYYCVGDIPLDPNTLYMVFNRDFAPLMFAWAYLKDDLWSIGTGGDDSLDSGSMVECADRFLAYMQERYGFQAEIVLREGFASPLSGGVYQGTGRLLFIGDAAGLVDLYRGVGMDNAALSARLAVKAIVKAEKSGRAVLECYQELMGALVKKVETNAARQTDLFASNQELETSLEPKNLLKSGLVMPLANFANTFLPAEWVILLPL